MQVVIVKIKSLLYLCNSLAGWRVSHTTYTTGIEYALKDLFRF
jgi:hypothetical protein